MSRYDHTGTPADPERRVHLDTWMEVVGEMTELAVDETTIVVELTSGTLAYPVESREGEILREQLAGKEGATVHILRIPDSVEPLLVSVC